MATSKTFNQIVDVFKYIADNHVFINSFSFVTELHEIAAQTHTKYPALIVMPERATTENNLLFYKFNVIVSDLVHKDESNESEVLSDTLQTLLDIKAWLTNNQCNGFTLKKESTITPFTERWDDEVSGHVGEFELEIWNTDSLCALPGLVPCNQNNGLTNIDTSSPCSQIACLSAGTINVNNFYISGDTINNYVTGSTVINEYFTTIVSGISSAITINIITGGTVNNYLSAFTYNIVTGITSGFTVDGTNIGGGAEVYSGKTGSTMMFFRTISGASAFVNIVQNPETITIDTVDRYWISGQSGNYSLMRRMPPNQYGQPYLAHYNTSFYSTISGGKANTIVGYGSYGANAIINGANNLINRSRYSTVAGRLNRINSGAYYQVGDNCRYSSILGGGGNTISRAYGSVIVNGTNHIIHNSPVSSILGGGTHRIINANFGAVVGGNSNSLIGNYSLILNGKSNIAYSRHTTVVNGTGNKVGNQTYFSDQSYSSIFNGRNNQIIIAHSGSSAVHSAINSGLSNIINASSYSTIVNGAYNILQDFQYSTILNGKNVELSGSHSLANGRLNIISANYSLVLASKNITVPALSPTLEHVAVIGLDGYIPLSGNTTYTDKLLATSLSGTSYRMVVADNEGLLSTQAIPSGGGSGEVNTASNLGSGTGIFASKVGVDLRFKSLSAGTNITLTSDANTIVITSTASGSSTGSSTNYRASAVTNSLFTGLPLKYTVVFSSAFSSANYAINITGEDERAWTVDTKTSSGFRINTNSNLALTGNTYWTAFEYNN